MSEAQKASAPPSLNGLLITDTTQVQQRQPNPQIKIIGQLFWLDGVQAQMTRPMTIKGKPYLIMTDELGHGAARIIDLSDETHPKIVSRLKLEVQLPQNNQSDVTDGGNGICASLVGDLPPGVGCPAFVYDGHYCSVDDSHNTTAIACGYFESGIRVFDVRDPANPREIAYFNPGPVVGQPLPGASIQGTTADHCAAQVRFVPETRQLWTTCQDNELLVLRFTNGTWPFTSVQAASNPLTVSSTPAPIFMPNTSREPTRLQFGALSALSLTLILVRILGRRRS
ncbi:MAG: LVIVD repeat-containing protein, partial [Candidatus Dormibacteria bacterium]